MRNLAILVGVPVILWCVLLSPGWLIWGDDAILHSSVALLLCLAPAVVTFVAITTFAKTQDARSLAALGASGVRMAVCLGGGMLLHNLLPERFPMMFLYWLVVFYLVILGLEVGLLVRQPPAGPDSQST